MRNLTITVNLIYKDGSQTPINIDYDIVAEAEVVTYNGDSFRYTGSPKVKFANFEQIGNTVDITNKGN